MGDFNAAVNWDTMNSTSFTEGHRLIKFVNNEFLHQWVEKPTRGENILDVVLPTQDNLVSNIKVGENTGKNFKAVLVPLPPYMYVCTLYNVQCTMYIVQCTWLCG